ncbi:MAG TPA: DNA-directed RNA polymerase subunit omega [Limnochordia bacterium]|nr:DNA-directed RNA polymerase subunit omega [Limnochordia bacterium]
MKSRIEADRYTAIVAVSLRARQLIEGVPPVIECKSTKPVTIAIEELKAGKIRWTHNKGEAN